MISTERHPGRLVCATALALFLLLAPAAGANGRPAHHPPKPITLGASAGAPRVAIDAAGTGYLTWSQSKSPSDAAHYCRTGFGGSTCGSPLAITSGFDTIDNAAYAFPVGGKRVLLLDSRCCVNYDDRFLYTSTDGGKHFGTPVQVGDENLNGAGDAGAAIYVPSSPTSGLEEIWAINGLQTGGSTFQATGTAGPPNGSAFSMSNGALTFAGSLAIDKNHSVAAYTDEHYKVFWRQLNVGATDPNSSASWSAPALVGKANLDSDAQLAGSVGTAGIYLAYNTGGALKEHWVLRRFKGNGFGAAVKLSDNTGAPGALAESPSGKVYFAWRDHKNRLAVRHTTNDAGTKLSSPKVLLGAKGGGVYTDVHLAVNSHGKAWATWVDFKGRAAALSFKAG